MDKLKIMCVQTHICSELKEIDFVPFNAGSHEFVGLNCF